MREWGIGVNSEFTYRSVEALDMDINRYTVKAGYPQWHFSSYSPRRGFVNQFIGDLILDGVTREEAVRRCRSKMQWATSGDTIQDYMTSLVTRCEEIVADGDEDDFPDGVSSMTLLEQHPDLDGIDHYLEGDDDDPQLPGPFRVAKFCSNDGTPPAFAAVVDHLHQVVMNGNPPDLFDEGNLATWLSRIATAFWNQFGAGLHPSWNETVEHLRRQPNDWRPRSRCKMRATLLNILIRIKIVTVDAVNEGNFQRVPQFLVNYCALDSWDPNNYEAPRKPQLEIKAIPSSSIEYAWMHETRRLRRKSVRYVYYGEQQLDIADLTRTQCRLLDRNPNPSIQEWNWAANQE